MNAVVAILLMALPAFAQPSTKAKAAKKAAHVHAIAGNCRTKPDGIYGKQDGVYYACIKRKEVCSNEKNAIPARMISAYDAAHPEVQAKIEEYRAGLKVEQPTKAAVKEVDAPAARTPAPPRTAIADERVKAIAIGTSREEVIQTLGEPYMKISGSAEILTYLLTSRGRAQLSFRDGKLSELRILPVQ